MRDFTLADLPYTPARQVGVWSNEDAEWHEFRATPGNVSGTMAGTISGLSKWESAVELWEKKTGRRSDQVPQSESMLWGNLLESVIIEQFQARHPELEVLTNCGSWLGADGWSVANPDGLYRAQDGVTPHIEVKTAAYPYGWNVPAEGVTGDFDGVPTHYNAQVQWYLRTLGLTQATLIALIGGSKYREFVIHADPHWQYADYQQAVRFRTCVLTDKKPDWPDADARLEKRKN